MTVTAQRSGYIDNLRLLVIVLVVVLHGAVTYSGIGSWYYKEATELSGSERIIFLIFQSFNQSFFMGLLFLLGGYMVPRAWDKKGSPAFMSDRVVRLGIPALFYMLVINPFIHYVLIRQAQTPFGEFFAAYYWGGQFIGGSGPLWFALALLIFSAVYVVVRELTAGQQRQRRERPYTGGDLFKLALLIAVCAFLVRTVQPIGTSILNMQLCFFSQYVVFFVVGVLAGRERLLDRLDYRMGVRCLQLAFGPGIVLWGAMFFGEGSGQIEAFMGGGSWQSLAYAAWESANGVLMSFGLMAVFRRRFDRQSPLIKRLADASFAVYVFHAPILVAVSKAAATWNASAWLKWLVVSGIALVVSFVLAHYLFNRIPVFRTAPPEMGRK